MQMNSIEKQQMFQELREVKIEQLRANAFKEREAEVKELNQKHSKKWDRYKELKNKISEFNKELDQLQHELISISNYNQTLIASNFDSYCFVLCGLTNNKHAEISAEATKKVLQLKIDSMESGIKELFNSFLKE